MKAQLIEPNMITFTTKILNKCREKRKNVHSIIMNTVLCILFVLVIGGILWFSKKSKLEREMKQVDVERKKEEYILDAIKKIRRHEEYRIRENNDKIFM